MDLQLLTVDWMGPSGSVTEDHDGQLAGTVTAETGTLTVLHVAI